MFYIEKSFAFIAIMLGIVLLNFIVGRIYQDRKIKKNGKRYRGHIVDHREDVSVKGDKIYYPIIKFTNDKGETKMHTSYIGGKKKYEIGYEIEVFELEDMIYVSLSFVDSLLKILGIIFGIFCPIVGIYMMLK